MLKKRLNKKIFEDIFCFPIEKSLRDLNNLKDLHTLALEEKDEETIHDCTEKIGQILQDVKKEEINCFYLVKTIAMTFI